MAVVDKSEVARQVAATLISDVNVLAVAVCGGRERAESHVEMPTEMLVVVSRMPLDLDGYGRRLIKWQQSSVLLSHYTPQWLETAIEEEAGCWLISGKVLYSKTIHDSGGILLGLRKVINSVSKERRMDACRQWLAEAQAFPAMLLSRASSLTKASERTLLRDDPAFARALFLLNGRPPMSEEFLADDILELERLPPGIGEITEVIRGLDRYDLRRFDRARKKYEAIIQGLKAIWEVS